MGETAMKKLFCIIFCLLLFVSCSHADGEPFTVFDTPFKAKIFSNCEGSTCEFLYDSRENTITFLAPDELVGFVISEGKDGAVISYEEISVPVSEYAARLLNICIYVFSAESDDATEIYAKDSANETLTVVHTDNCEYAFLGNGTPHSVTGEYEGINFEFILISFEVAQ